MSTSASSEPTAPVQPSPQASRQLPRVLEAWNLRRLRGQPGLGGINLETLCRELWADLTGEDHLSPSDEELIALHQGLQADALIAGLRRAPGDTLREALWNMASASPDMECALAAQLILALRSLTPGDLCNPSLQFAAETVSSGWCDRPEMSETVSQIIPITYLLTLAEHAPEALCSVMARSQPPHDLMTVPRVGDTLSAVENDLGPGPLLARALLPELQVQVPPDLRAQGLRPTPLDSGHGVFAPQRLRAALAQASWRSGVYSPVRHPHLSREDISTPSLRAQLSGQPDTLTRQAAQVLLARTASLAARDDLEIFAEVRPAGDPRLSTPEGDVLWSFDDALPCTVIPVSDSSQRDHNLRVKYAAHTLLRPEPGQPDDRAVVRAVCAAMLLASHSLDLPSMASGAALLENHDPAMPAFTSPEVRAVLTHLSGLPGVNPDDQAAAAAALRQTEGD